jgi:hypothetical protein
MPVACQGPDALANCQSAAGSAAATGIGQETDLYINVLPVRQLDMVCMIDNSPSMAPKVIKLATARHEPTLAPIPPTATRRPTPAARQHAARLRTSTRLRLLSRATSPSGLLVPIIAGAHAHLGRTLPARGLRTPRTRRLSSLTFSRSILLLATRRLGPNSMLSNHPSRPSLSA